MSTLSRMTSPARRAALDACPTALDLHEAADGFLARVRLPGGLLSTEQLLGLLELSALHGDGALDLTSRGNVQLRGIRDRAGTLGDALIGLGLLPAPEVEKARTIQSSPLSADGPGALLLASVVRALDAAICATPALAGLSGRFVFAVDDGSLTSELAQADVAVILDSRDARLVLAGKATDKVVAAAEAPTLMVQAALEFLALRDAAGIWRIHELVGGAETLANVLGTALLDSLPAKVCRLQPGNAGSGWLVAVARLGRLNAEQTRALLAVTGEGLVQVLPYGRLLLGIGQCDADVVAAAAELGGAGLIVTAGDPWADVSACAGLGCARATSDARALATPVEIGPVHYSACDRQCGRPKDALSVLT